VHCWGVLVWNKQGCVTGSWSSKTQMVRIKTICGLPNVDIFHGAPINDDHGFFLGGGNLTKWPKDFKLAKI
jgi:hypothetical protein